MNPSSTPFTSPKYRPDIDGLRAMAVLSVVAFHAFPAWIRGGFIGVDIFFVISGFLISTIIFENLEKDTFSFREFYARRIKRIFPALILVLTACFAFGWFTLLADEYQQLGKHMAAGAGFISNFVLWSEVGYFDNSADTKPLLHLWSLGIEEQFYMLWPLVLWAAWKKKFNLLSIAILFFIVSFVLNIKGVKTDPSTTFYLPHTRFWELLAGSILAWFHVYRQKPPSTITLKLDRFLASILYRHPVDTDGATLRNLASFLGFALLLFGFWRIHQDIGFPGKWALVPVLGAVLIILAGAQAWINRVILSNKLVVWFGLISFPLYLWHWPLLSFARIMGGETISFTIRISAVLIAITLAWLTYQFVEKYIRHHKKYSVIIIFSLTLSMIFIAILGYSIFQSRGFQNRAIVHNFQKLSESIRFSARQSDCHELGNPDVNVNLYCTLGEKSKPVKFFVFGDSHAFSLLPAFEKIVEHSDFSIQHRSAGGCLPLLGLQRYPDPHIDNVENNCTSSNNYIFNHIKKSEIKNIILIAKWSAYLKRPFFDINGKKLNNSKSLVTNALEQTVKSYNNIGVKVFIIEDNPEQLVSPRDILRKGLNNNQYFYAQSIPTTTYKEKER